TARGILDGHIVLSRHLANRNHYPAIDVLASVSRLMPDITERGHYDRSNELKSLMAVHRDAQDLINIGAYRAGSNPEIDLAIKVNPQINDILLQRVEDYTTIEDTVSSMNVIEL
ncbi:MAG: EscN/YscN/HrcN family type III secretion system ATPase, partial [Oscillospiraceae bacterium]|nr:EscN/YscN/HrcN family type III secretion system ATPase [Oscillospiraceae bacterium]